MFGHAAAWRVNLWVTGSGAFINIIAMTVMLPFLPHYLGELGDYSETEAWLWSSLIYASTFITAALFAPLWGHLADRYGCRVNLIRAGVGMLICMTLMGLATSAWQMVILRLLAGVAGGYTSGATILMAKEAPESRGGQAQGVLFACILAGSLAGPIFGGIFSAYIGMREAFFISGGAILFNVVLTAFLVKEKPVSQRLSNKSMGLAVPLNFKLWAVLIATMGLLMATLSIEPIIYSIVGTLYHYPFEISIAAGIVLSATALGSLLSSLVLGHLADRYDAERVALYGFVIGTVFIIPQAFVTDVYTLMMLRFAMGLALGGVLPCLKVALKHAYADRDNMGRVMGISTSFQYIGQVLGPLMGGVVAAALSIDYAFYITAIVTVLCALLIMMSRRYSSVSVLP